MLDVSTVGTARDNKQGNQQLVIFGDVEYLFKMGRWDGSAKILLTIQTSIKGHCKAQLEEGLPV